MKKIVDQFIYILLLLGYRYDIVILLILLYII